MEPLGFKITTMVYDSAGNRTLSEIVLRNPMAKEGTGPVVTYTYDPKSSASYLLKPDAPDTDGEAGK